MAYNYHLNRIEMAFKRAALPQSTDARAQAHYDLAMRLQRIIQRSLTRDDAIQKERKRLGIPHSIKSNYEAQNNHIIGAIKEAKEQAAIEAARLNPAKFNATDASLVI